MFLVLKIISPVYPAKISSLGFLANTHRWAHLLKKQSSILFTFAYQGKQASVFRCRLQHMKGSLPLPFSVLSKQTEIAVFH
jgi:hypothetical protein